MLSRQDNENIYLMYSDMLHFWFTKELLMRPTYPWVSALASVQRLANPSCPDAVPLLLRLQDKIAGEQSPAKMR